MYDNKANTLSGSQSGANCYGDAQQPSPVLNTLHGINDARASLHDRISMLEARLSIVLSPEVPTSPESTGGKAPPLVSELAGRLGDVNADLWYAVARLENLANRLTV